MSRQGAPSTPDPVTGVNPRRDRRALPNRS
jgi:hypothetical protein